MNFSQALQQVFRNYANFSGRARRSEYWYFILLNAIVSLFSFTPLAPVAAVYSLAVLIPTLAVCVRRLHDTGRAGTYLFLLLVPIVGEILIVVWLVQDSETGNNRFGPSPKGSRAVPAEQSRTQPVGGLAVRCLAGPLQGQTYPLRSQGLMFGRNPNCTVRMPDGTPGLSGTHCMLRYHQGVPELVDLGSSYGTYTGDGKRLPPHYPEPVAAGTRFYLGSQNLLFQIVVL